MGCLSWCVGRDSACHRNGDMVFGIEPAASEWRIWGKTTHHRASSSPVLPIQRTAFLVRESQDQNGLTALLIDDVMRKTRSSTLPDSRSDQHPRIGMRRYFLHLFFYRTSKLFTQPSLPRFVINVRFVKFLTGNFKYLDFHTEKPKARSIETAFSKPFLWALARDSASTAHLAAVVLSLVLSILSRIRPASFARFLGGRAMATVASCFSSVGIEGIMTITGAWSIAARVRMTSHFRRRHTKPPGATHR